MDSSLTVRSRDPLARRIVGRSNAVRTDLSPSQSVNAAETAASLHHAPVESVAHEPVIDSNCQSLLDHEREEREENERRRARKDEILARQRAYGRNAEPSAIAADEVSAHRHRGVMLSRRINVVSGFVNEQLPDKLPKHEAKPKRRHTRVHALCTHLPCPFTGL